jgi:hypothetical protein
MFLKLSVHYLSFSNFNKNSFLKLLFCPQKGDYKTTRSPLFYIYLNNFQYVNSASAITVFNSQCCVTLPIDDDGLL